MQLLIPYAFVTDDPRCAQAAAGLQLPVLEQLLRRLNLTRTDTLRLRHHVNLRTQEHPDKSITLVAAGRRLNVAEQHREALQIVLSGDEFAVGDLPLPDDEALDLARRLLLAGIVMA